MTNIEDIFPGGRWNGSSEYIIKCPICLDHPTHSHCSINAERAVYRCFYCGAAGKLRYLIKHYAGDQSLPFSSDEGITERVRASETPFDQFLELSEFCQDYLGEKAWDYLLHRGLSACDIKYNHIRWADRGRYFGRVILPVFEDERVVCWSARAFLAFVGPKYLFPYYGETLLTNSEAIFNYDKAMHSPVINKSLVLVEGIFDAIAVNKVLSTEMVGACALSLLSKNISDSQSHKLMRFDEKKAIFYVMMDPDALVDGVKIAKRLSSQDGRIAKVCYLKGAKDPAEATEGQIMQAIFDSVLYNTDMELKVRLGHGL